MNSEPVLKPLKERADLSPWVYQQPRDEFDTMSAEARYHYPTNLTDAQWALVEPLLPEPKSGPGLPGCPVVDRRRVMDGILYVNKAGGQWRLLPREFGAWQTVYGYFNTWSKLVLFVLVTAANLDDREGLPQDLRGLLRQGAVPDSQAVGGRRAVDAGYVSEALWHRVRALKGTHKIDLEVVGRQGKGFQAAAARWCPSAG